LAATSIDAVSQGGLDADQTPERQKLRVGDKQLEGAITLDYELHE